MFAINLIVEVVSAPFGWIFYFNDKGYFRGDFFIIYEVFYFFSLVYLIFGLVRVGEKFRHRDVSTIGMTLVILIAGIAPMTLYQIHITYIAVAIASSLSYIYYGQIVRDILNGITDEESISFASDIATYHHEWWNGKGYPEGLKGESIPLPARIMAIADVFDALVSERCYKKAMTPDEAFRTIQDEAGSHFDPKLIRVFLDHKEDFLKYTGRGNS